METRRCLAASDKAPLAFPNLKLELYAEKRYSLPYCVSSGEAFACLHVKSWGFVNCSRSLSLSLLLSTFEHKRKIK